MDANRTAMATIVLTACLTPLVWFLGTAPTAAQALPRCGDPAVAAEERDWEFIRNQQLGLSVRDATSHWIGPFANRTKESGFPKAWGGRNWFPHDVVRHTYCGLPVKFTMFAGPGRELDFHPFLRPSNGFAHILEESAARGTLEAGGVLYGEVTLPAALEKAWLGKNYHPLFLSSERVSFPDPDSGFCMYGPWVVEEFHENKPEIHPAGQMWYRNAGKLHWIVTQDDSDRFGNKGGRKNFCPVEGSSVDCDTRMPAPPDYSNWWTHWSVRVVGRIPFEYGPATSERHEIEVRYPTAGTGDGSLTFTTGAVSRLKVFYAEDKMNLSVTVTEICQTDSAVRGYVNLYATVEAAGPSQEGLGARHFVVSGTAFRAPGLDAAPAAPGGAAAAPPAATEGLSFDVRVRDEEPGERRRKGPWTFHEFDLQVTYRGEGDEAEMTAERRNRLLGRFDPDEKRGGYQPITVLLPDYEREYRVTGPKPFTVRAWLETSSGRLDLTPDCRKPPSAGSIGFCLEENKAPILDGQRDVADLGIWVRDGFKGRVRIAAQVQEPAPNGPASDRPTVETQRAISLPVSANPHESAFDGALQLVLGDLGWSQEELVRRWRLDNPGLFVRPGCDVVPRRARQVHLTMLAATRDGDVTAEETTQLRALARLLKEAPPVPPDCQPRVHR